MARLPFHAMGRNDYPMIPHFIVFRHGPEKLREFPGFHDEKLKGKREGQRSSRLSLQYRVIYAVEQDIVMVFVLEITPHNY